MKAHAPSGPPARIIAHRGASYAAPENTLAAFCLAWEEHGDGIETDLRLTRDGRVVAIHDETTGRTAGIDLRVSEATLAELRKLDLGAWKGERWAGERIPTLAEVLSAVPSGKRLFLEIKSGPEILDPLLRALKGSRLMPERAAILAFQQEVVSEVKRRAPHLKAFWLVDFEPGGSAAAVESGPRSRAGREGPAASDRPQGEGGAAAGGKNLGAIGKAQPSSPRAPAGPAGRRLETGPGSVTVASHDVLSPSLEEILDTARHVRADGVDVRADRRLDAAFVTTVRKAGLELHVWTVNDRETAGHFRALGVDSMTTDRPAWLRRVLASG